MENTYMHAVEPQSESDLKITMNVTLKIGDETTTTQNASRATKDFQKNNDKTERKQQLILVNTA